MSVAETSTAGTQIKSTLDAGIDALAQHTGDITFTKYVRLVLPLDGFVFWIKADILSPSAIYNANPLNEFAFNQHSAIETPAATAVVSGSWHYAVEGVQREDETMDINRCVFTAKTPIDDFDVIGPNVLYIGEFPGVKKFAFSGRNWYAPEAGLYHYRGDAVYPALESQIIDSVIGFDSSSLVVSNSLPLWLTMDQYFPVYPSFLAPLDLEPPYATIHCIPESLTPLQMMPAFDALSSSYQLVSERVRVTTYGVRNNEVWDYINYVYNNSLATDAFGIMGDPALPRDLKRTQVEMNVIAMKKEMTFEISYYQQRINDIAQQYILSAIPTYMVQSVP